MEATLTLSQLYLRHPIDRGCKFASNYLGSQSLCVECPFTSCLKDIRYSTKLLLQNSEIIKHTHEAHNQKLPIDKIGKLFPDIPIDTIKYWIKHKNRIQKLLSQYSWAIQYI